MSDVYAPQPVRTLTPGDVKEIMVDATTPSQGAKVDASGNQYVMVSNTSANPIPIQGGNSTAVSTTDTSDGPVAPGSAAANSSLGAGVYNSTLPTVVSGQQVALQLDSSGRQIIAQSSAAALNATVTQGPASTASGAWYQKVTDGTNTAAVKAASTAALATDPSLVVALSPNSPLPAGTAIIGAVNQGTSPWVTSDLADGSATGGTAGSKSLLAGGVYNSSAPTLTTGQQAGLQLDVSGNLKVALASDTAVLNTKDAADGPVTPGAVASNSILGGVQYNSTLPTLTTGQQVAVQADSSGRLLVGSIASPLPAGTNLLGGTNVYVGGTIASTTNPVPVVVTSNLPGTQVNKYNTTASLAAAAVANHVYTITSGKTFNGKFFTATGSGKIRADVQTSPDGSTYSTFFTQMSSPAYPNIQLGLDLLTLSDSGTGSTIRIQITNEDTQAFDVFSSICGTEN